MQKFIEVKNLHKEFQPGKAVLKDVNFLINKEDRIALLGHNGSGKSTLLRSLACLTDRVVGEIIFCEQNVLKFNRAQLRDYRKKIGFIFQQHNLVGRLSVLSNIIHGELAKKSSPRFWYQFLAPQKIRQKAFECLDAVKLDFIASKRADQLSGGQAQRVAIARALMQDAEIVFADEPVASLDPKAAEEVMEIFLSLVTEQKKTLVFSTHNLDHAIKYSTRVIALKSGEVVLDRETTQITSDELQNLYQG